MPSWTIVILSLMIPTAGIIGFGKLHGLSLIEQHGACLGLACSVATTTFITGVIKLTVRFPATYAVAFRQMPRQIWFTSIHRYQQTTGIQPLQGLSPPNASALVSKCLIGSRIPTATKLIFCLLLIDSQFALVNGFCKSLVYNLLHPTCAHVKLMDVNTLSWFPTCYLRRNYVQDVHSVFCDFSSMHP